MTRDVTLQGVVRRLPDFRVVDHGSVTLLEPRTRAARDWCLSHLPDDAPRLGRAYAVEPRFLGPILEGAQADGLRV